MQMLPSLGKWFLNWSEPHWGHGESPGRKKVVECCNNFCKSGKEETVIPNHFCSQFVDKNTENFQIFSEKQKKLLFLHILNFKH